MRDRRDCPERENGKVRISKMEENNEALEPKDIHEEDSRGIEETFELLDALLRRLEGDELTLEESFELYARGLNLVKQCRQGIDEVEKKVLVLEESGEFHEL